MFLPLRGQFSPYSTATSRMAIRGWLPWVLGRTVCHEMRPSTTLSRPPSTIPEFVKIKPQVESLPIFEKVGYGRPLRPKRSRWALFVAQHQISLFGLWGIKIAGRFVLLGYVDGASGSILSLSGNPRRNFGSPKLLQF